MRHFYKLRCPVLLLLAAMMLLTTPALAAEEQDPTPVLLSWTGAPTTTMTFAWTEPARRETSVEIVTEPQYNETGFEDAMEFPASCRDVSLDGSGLWHYEATAEDLEPGTVYLYRAGEQTGRFTTADPAADTVTFAYLGDPQTANDTAADYAAWGDLTESILARNPELSFAVLGGDNVNSGISVEEFTLFSQNAGRVFSSVPMFSTVGNHESNFIGGKAELYLDWFAFPENGPEGFMEECYSFDAANCHVLVLNSWIFSGEQPLTEEDLQRVDRWAAADLAASTADWQVAAVHVPVYAVHADATAEKVKEHWAPIFEQYGVDLVFEGHQHVYSRSYPMYQGQIDYEKGVTYIMGVSGSKHYDSADETFAVRTVYGVPAYQLVQTDGNAMTVQCLDAEGNEPDFVSIPRREVSVSRGAYIELLWQAAGAPAPDGASPFSDAGTPAVIWAYQAGIVRGCGGGRFDPDSTITAEQIALIQARMGGNL